MRKAMAKMGYNQKKLADASGITPEAIGRYLKNKRIPNSCQLQQIAHALHVSMDYLMGDGSEADLNGGG
jgi:transcriptional regulator with XRE-family HTH domain